jgi:hypothetical protein
MCLYTYICCHNLTHSHWQTIEPTANNDLISHCGEQNGDELDTEGPGLQSQDAEIVDDGSMNVASAINMSNQGELPKPIKVNNASPGNNSGPAGMVFEPVQVNDAPGPSEPSCNTAKSPDDTAGLVDNTAEDDREMWPEWMKQHVPQLEAGPGSPEFQLVLAHFIKLESSIGFPTGQVRTNQLYSCMGNYSEYCQGKNCMLSKINRPEEISRWIQGGRKTSPRIQDVRAYATSWKRWWASLQPSSRHQSSRQNLLRVVDATETWEELRKGSITAVCKCLENVAQCTFFHLKVFLSLLSQF